MKTIPKKKDPEDQKCPGVSSMAIACGKNSRTAITKTIPFTIPKRVPYIVSSSSPSEKRYKR